MSNQIQIAGGIQGHVPEQTKSKHNLSYCKFVNCMNTLIHPDKLTLYVKRSFFPIEVICYGILAQVVNNTVLQTPKRHIQESQSYTEWKQVFWPKSSMLTNLFNQASSTCLHLAYISPNLPYNVPVQVSLKYSNGSYLYYFFWFHVHTNLCVKWLPLRYLLNITPLTPTLISNSPDLVTSSFF